MSLIFFNIIQSIRDKYSWFQGDFYVVMSLFSPCNIIQSIPDKYSWFQGEVINVINFF